MKQSNAQPPASNTAPPTSTVEGARIYFGNVPYQITENEIKTFFQQCGEVKAVHMVRDKLSKRFQGYGFITFATKEAQKAALLLNGQFFKERKLKVNLETKDMPTKSGKRIFIKNIGVNTPDEEVKKQFQQFGTIEGFFTIKDKHTRQSKGFGFMDFSTAEEAKAALSMNGKQAFGQTLTVSKAHSSRQENMATGRGGFRGNFRGAGWGGQGGFARAYAPYEEAPWGRPSGGYGYGRGGYSERGRGGYSGRGRGGYSGRGRGGHSGIARGGNSGNARGGYHPAASNGYQAAKTGFGFGAGNQKQHGWQKTQVQSGWQAQQQGGWQQAQQQGGWQQTQQQSGWQQTQKQGGWQQNQQKQAYQQPYQQGAYQPGQPSPYKQF